VTALPRTRRQLLRGLLDARGAREARRLARRAGSLADERTLRMLLDRFSPLPRDDRQRAGAIVRAAEAIAATTPGNVCQAMALRLRGVLDHLDGRGAAARNALLRAAEVLAEHSMPVEAGDVFRTLIDVSMRAEDYAEARSMARRAAAQYRRAGGVDPRRRGSLEMNLGNLHHRRDDHRQALAAYGRARRHYVRAGESLHLAIVDYNRANVLVLLDRTAEARSLYERARGEFVARRLPALEAQADFALAGIDLLEDRLDACLDKLSEARKRLEARGDRLRVAHADLDAAEALLRLNRPAEAERAAAAAERFFRRAGQRAEVAMCTGALAGAALQRGRSREASRLFRRGRDVQRALGNRVAAAALEIGRAQAELRSGHPRLAARIAEGAARLMGRHRLGSRRARAMAVAAEAHLTAGRVSRAGRLALGARALARRTADRRAELSCLLTLSRVARRRRSPAAYRHLLAAEACVEQMRRGVTAEESRLAFAVDKSAVYEALVLDRLQHGGRRALRQALVFAERGKARALAEHLARGSSALGAGRSRTRKLLQRLLDLERRLAVAESRLQEPAVVGLRGARIEAITLLTRSRMQTLALLSRRDAERAALAGARLPDCSAALRALAPDEVILEYTQAGGALHLFAIERNRVEAFVDLIDVERLSRLINLVGFHLGKGALGEDHAERFGGLIEGTVRAHLAELHSVLLGPIAARLDGKRVRIVPHGVLHGLPFHALEGGGCALVERCTVSYVPSLATLQLLRQRQVAASAAPVILGVADHVAPLIQREVDLVRRRVRRARVYRGRAATSEALLPRGRRPALLHVACHGFYGQGGPWDSALRLGDAWFSLSDLYALRGMARLVVLSGCETGKGTVYSGDEWIGLVRGFLQAGARAVVASMWEVHDRCTVALMGDFYRNLTAGFPVAQALTLAQREARRRESLTLRWAPFAVIGEPEVVLPRTEAA